jgi:hypothetical protein
MWLIGEEINITALQVVTPCGLMDRYSPWLIAATVEAGGKYRVNVS